MPPRRSPLRRIQALAVHQPGVGAQGQELLGGGGVAVHRCQHQGGSALVVAGVHRRSLADEAFYLLGVARTGSVPHVAWQRCPEAFLHGGGGCSVAVAGHRVGQRAAGGRGCSSGRCLGLGRGWWGGLFCGSCCRVLAALGVGGGDRGGRCGEPRHGSGCAGGVRGFSFCGCCGGRRGGGGGGGGAAPWRGGGGGGGGKGGGGGGGGGLGRGFGWGGGRGRGGWGGL